MRIKLLILTFLLLFFGARPVFAAATISAPSDAPSEVQINQTFSFNSILSSIQAGETYFVKCRLGQSGQSSSLNDGQTYNPTTNTWLSDTGAWVDMPTVTTSGTSITFSIQCRVKSSAVSEQKVLYSRACLKKSDGTCGTSFQSSSGVNLLVSPEPTPSASPNPSTSSSPASSPSSSSSTSSSSSFTISNIPSKIDSTESFNPSISLSLPNSTNTTFYLKGAFKKKDGSNYFGLTKVGESWIKNNQTYSDHLKITTDSSGKWSGNLEMQPDILDNGYEGSGDYIFKVGRYTEVGSLNWSNEVNVNIVAQEIIMEDEEKEVLGTETKRDEKTTVYNDEISLDKYVKAASKAASLISPSPETEVKGEKRINLFSIIGTILVIIGAGALSYGIYNYIRKRNNEVG